MKTDRCRSAKCGAAIVWAVSSRGRPMPFDAAPAPLEIGYRLLPGHKDMPPVAVHVGAGEKLTPDELLYVSHHATCVDVASFRRRS